MSFQEKRTITALISTIVVFGWYFSVVFQKYNAETFTTTTVLHFWGAAILILIPVTIVFNIIIHIVFSIINTVVTNEAEPTITDELDKLIELKSTRNFYHLFMLGFVLSVATLVFDLPPTAMFVVLMITILAAALLGDVSRLYYYRRGV